MVHVPRPLDFVRLALSAKVPGPVHKAILVALAHRADRVTGRDIWPAVRTLAADACCCERTVQRVLGELKRLGLIRVQLEATPTRPRTWQLEIGALSEAARRGDSQSPGDSLSPGDCESPGDNVSSGGVTHSREAGDTESPDLPSTFPLTFPREITRARPLDGFQAFWSAWPTGHRKAKGAAELAWRRIGPDTSLRESIVAAVGRQQAHLLRDGGRFCPHPSTWLNQRRWEDEIGPSTAPPLNGATASTVDRVRAEGAAALAHVRAVKEGRA